MNKWVSAFLGFICGSVAGCVVGKKLLEEHYNQVVQEEIDSVKSAFRKHLKDMTDAKVTAGEKSADTLKTGPDTKTERVAMARSLMAQGLSCADIAQKMGMNESTIRSLLNDWPCNKKDYRKYYLDKKAGASVKEAPKEEKKTSPYVIPPEEFGMNTGYEEISLTYYVDGTVADDDDNAMSEEDIEETIGRESLTHFGEYEADAVFVRNDDMRTDYEVLRDEGRYSDGKTR
ncbi:MAG: helix-turn-helix domain-containing protein [Clostridia bacterium]